MSKINKLLPALVFTLLAACSPLDVISSMVGKDKGIEATAQVGENNNKGTVAVQAGTENSTGDVAGDSKVTNNSSLGMASMALIGLIPFVLLAFYLLPAPKWIQRRYNERGKDDAVP